MREIVNAICCVLRGGIAWSLLPKDLPPWSRRVAGSPGSATAAPGDGSTTVWWRRRERVGREASPTRIEAVRKACSQIGLAVIARRWVVDRRFAWISRNRRLAKDFEATIESVEVFLYAASSVILLRRLAG